MAALPYSNGGTDGTHWTCPEGSIASTGRVLRNLGFLKRGLDDLATLEVGNVPYTLGFKVCMYTVPPEYGEYGSSRRAPLANALARDGILYS